MERELKDFTSDKFASELDFIKSNDVYWDTRDDAAPYLNLESLMDELKEKTHIYIKKGKHKAVANIGKLSIATVSKLSCRHHFVGLVSGTGAIYLDSCYYPMNHLPEYHDCGSTFYSWPRCLKISFVADQRVFEFATICNLTLCEFGEVLSSYNRLTRRYDVELPSLEDGDFESLVALRSMREAK